MVCISIRDSDPLSADTAAAAAAWEQTKVETLGSVDGRTGEAVS